jgi:hypothetical protein
MAASVKLLLWDCERRGRVIRFADCRIRDWVSYWHTGKLHSSGGVILAAEPVCVRGPVGQGTAPAKDRIRGRVKAKEVGQGALAPVRTPEVRAWLHDLAAYVEALGGRLEIIADPPLMGWQPAPRTARRD